MACYDSLDETRTRVSGVYSVDSAVLLRDHAWSDLQQGKRSTALQATSFGNPVATLDYMATVGIKIRTADVRGIKWKQLTYMS